MSAPKLFAYGVIEGALTKAVREAEFPCLRMLGQALDCVRLAKAEQGKWNRIDGANDECLQAEDAKNAAGEAVAVEWEPEEDLSKAAVWQSVIDREIWRVELGKHIVYLRQDIDGTDDGRTRTRWDFMWHSRRCVE